MESASKMKKYQGSGGYIVVNNRQEKLVKNWSMSERPSGTFGAPGDEGYHVYQGQFVIYANSMTPIGLSSGDVIALQLKEGGSALYYHGLAVAQILSVDYSGALANQVVTYSVSFKSYSKKEIINVVI